MAPYPADLPLDQITLPRGELNTFRAPVGTNVCQRIAEHIHWVRRIVPQQTGLLRHMCFDPANLGMA